VSFAAITLCVASQRVFIFVIVYFVIGSVRKLLDTPSYIDLYRVRSLASIQREQMEIEESRRILY
jgi:hypothetical protein